MNDRDEMERAYQRRHALIVTERDDFEAGWRAAMQTALEAVEAEHLLDPTEHHGDLVYERAVSDCAHAVRAVAGNAQ
jgi:hypothetical protein